MAEEEEYVELVVVESRIDIGGVARMHSHTLEMLNVESGDIVVVSHGKKSVLVKAFGDMIIAEGEVSLRKRERKKLGVREGDYVRVSRYKSVSKGLRSRVGGLFGR